MKTAPTGDHIRHVDGLRAVAVLAVMAYHLFPQWLPGGLAGVDLFFVISGFVVTASLTGHHGESLGTFIGGFYRRRVTRILPALILVLLTTSVAFVLLVPASWLSDQNEHIGVLAYFGLSNIGLQRQADSYFSPRAEFNPFTHTWSLGIEEQFYLIVPWLLFVQVFRHAAGRRGAAFPWTIVAISIASLAAMAFWTTSAPLVAFYSIASRLWELAIGCLWFLARWAAGRRRNARRVAKWLDLVGIVLLAAVLFLADARQFPFPWVLAAIAAAVCLIGFPADDSPVRRFLARRETVWIGLRSYSLYLWHWPVYVLMRWTIGLDAWWTWPFAVLASFALATASYRWIESPPRRSRAWRSLPPAAGIAIGIGIAAGAAWASNAMFNHREALGLSMVTRHAVDWYVKPDDPTIDEAAFHCRTEGAYRSVEGILVIERRPVECDDHALWPGRKAFVLGDSHATAYASMFHRLTADTGIAVTTYSVPGCAFLGLRVPMAVEGGGLCPARLETAVDDVLKQATPGDLVFLASLRVPRFVDQWGRFDEQEAWRQAGPEGAAMRKSAVEEAKGWLRRFEAKGLLVVFEAPTPVFHAPAFRCVDAWNAMNDICRGGLEVPRARHEAYRSAALEAMKELARGSASVMVFDPLPALCDDQACRAVARNGRPLFFDADHLSRYGNETIYPAFREFLVQAGLERAGNQASPPFEVVDWGPRETRAKTPFNVQAGGRSAIWITVRGVHPGMPISLSFGGERLEGIVVGEGLVTSVIPDALFATPGERSVVLAQRGAARKLVVGTFSVRP